MKMIQRCSGSVLAHSTKSKFMHELSVAVGVIAIVVVVSIVHGLHCDYSF